MYTGIQGSPKTELWRIVAIWKLRKLSLELVGQISRFLENDNFPIFFFGRIFLFWLPGAFKIFLPLVRRYYGHEILEKKLFIWLETVSQN